MKTVGAGLLAALAVIFGAAYAAVSIAALIDVATRPDKVRTLVVAVLLVSALLAARPVSDRWRTGAWLGIGIGLVVVFGAEIVGGNPSFGAGQIGALLGAVAVMPLLGWLWSGTLQRPVATFAIVALLLLVAVALVRAVYDGGGLGHDESAYALKARTWLEGTPDTGWQLHRAPLISALGVPVIAITEAEVPIRMVAVALALLALVTVWLVSRRLGGGWSGVIAVATVGVSLSYLRRGSEYLTDIPAAGLLLVIVWIVLRAVADPDRSRRLVLWLGPLVLAAFYMRYQSALSIVGIALATAILWPNVVAKLKRPLLATGAITVVGLVPHLIWATVVAGTPWGVVLITQDAGGRAFLGEGLVDYARAFPVDLAGPAGAMLMTVGILWLVWALFRPGGDGKDQRLAIFVLVVVSVAVIPLGLVSHGEPRFVFFPVWLLICVGSMTVVRLVGAIPGKYGVAAVGLAAILWLPVFNETARRADVNAEARGETFQVVVDASNQIQAESGGSCGVLTTYQPQVNWYSTCATAPFRPQNSDLGVGELDTTSEYALLFESGKRQPTGDQLARYLALGPTERVNAQNDRIGDATIVEISRG